MSECFCWLTAWRLESGWSVMAQSSSPDRLGFTLALVVMGLVAVLLGGAGVYGIVTGHALLPARQKRLLRLIGIHEVTGLAARVIGAGQSLVAVCLLLFVIVAPFFFAPGPRNSARHAAVGGNGTGRPSSPAGSTGTAALVPPAGETPASGTAANNPVGGGAPPVSNAAAIVGAGEPEAAPKPEPLPPLGRPPAPMPRRPVEQEATVPTALLGENWGQPFEDKAPPGGVLVGMEVSLREQDGQLVGICPIYQLGEQYVHGRWHGTAEGVQHRLLAPAEHAVGRIDVDVGTKIQGLQLQYQRVEDGDRLGTEATVTASWVGTQGSGERQSVTSEGTPILGIFGHGDRELYALGILRALPSLATAELALPSLHYVTEDLPPKDSLLGNPEGDSFVDRAPEGALLVGLRVFFGPNWGGAPHGLQPVYQVADRYALGQRHGRPGGPMQQTLARPGYAVSAIEVRAGLVMNALKVRYAPVDGTSQEGNAPYETDWIGVPGGRSLGWAGDGRPWVGLWGTYLEDLMSLGPLHAANLRVTGKSSDPAGEVRAWTSADGKFRVEAVLVRRQEQAVVLRRADNGKQITVPLAMLSAEDRAYVLQASGE